MIDPITALAGIQSAVALIKKVSKTVDDVASLGPVLGKYFDAKHNAVKASTQAKASGNKSSMATAIEIEMALDQAAQFERQLQLLFMQAGKIDVWNRIKVRSQQMDAEADRAAKKQAQAKKQRSKANQEAMQIILIVTAAIVITLGMGWGVYELVQHCGNGRCR